MDASLWLSVSFLFKKKKELKKKSIFVVAYVASIIDQSYLGFSISFTSLRFLSASNIKKKHKVLLLVSDQQELLNGKPLLPT